jgi:hypothetical protein
MRWTKLDLTCTHFKKNNQFIIALNIHRPFVAAESTTWIFFIFQPSKICVSPGVVSSLSPLCTVSPPADIATPPCHVTLPSYGAKTSLLPLLHLPVTLCLVASSLKPKLKHWMHTTTIGHPPRTTQFSSFTVIKMSSQPWPLSSPLNRVSILPPF